MIIPSQGLLALSSLTQEIQGPKEEENGFGHILAAIESQVTLLPDQEEGERQALESVLQALAAMFQSFTLANPLEVDATPGAGDLGLVSGLSAGGFLPGVLLDPGGASGLDNAALAHLLPTAVSEITQDIVPSPLAAGDGSNPAPTPLTALLHERFALFLRSLTFRWAEPAR